MRGTARPDRYDKAAAFAKEKVHGHDDQIDSGFKKVEEYLDKQN